jgi:plastocyanin
MTARRLARQALTPLVIAAAGSLLLLTVTGGGAAAAQEEPVVDGTAELIWEPAELQIAPGDTVTFEISGGPPHPVAPAAGGPEFDASACGQDAMSAEGDSCQITFEEEGTFPFICTVHESQGMTGTITVGEGGEAPAEPAETPTPEPSIADTPAAATTEDGPPMIYYAGWGLLALGALIALGAVVGYLRFAPDFRRGAK